jgi:hypothetical protein
MELDFSKKMMLIDFVYKLVPLKSAPAGIPLGSIYYNSTTCGTYIYLGNGAWHRIV